MTGPFPASFLDFNSFSDSLVILVRVGLFPFCNPSPTPPLFQARVHFTLGSLKSERWSPYSSSPKVHLMFHYTPFRNQTELCRREEYLEDPSYGVRGSSDNLCGRNRNAIMLHWCRKFISTHPTKSTKYYISTSYYPHYPPFRTRVILTIRLAP